ncbi:MULTISPECIES: hypothetical protein [Pseudomonas]|uniref:COG3904 family protein n=1 Tax=Pseudomonas TaxID=286 RepID=UPI0018E725ED|nr:MULTISPECIES: hypothetical protein [Pseudomonas]MBJ2213959.1 hypothetical protein [Pseudomonas carnis]MBP5947846.1 hypothetical protein [Pseudomonas sp. P9(2020)]
MKRTSHIAWALSVIAISMQAHAAEPSIKILKLAHPDGRAAPAEVYIDGEITPALASRLSSELAAARVNRATIYLNSNGGDLQASMALGDFIRAKGLYTAIGRQGSGYGQSLPGACQSACVMTFAGGLYRFADERSYFGIHRFYSRTSGTQDLDLGQVLSAAITGYLIRMGVSPTLFERMVSAGRGALQKLPVPDAIALKLVNDGILPASWQIIGKAGKVYLQGAQETWNGTGRVQMACTRSGGLTYTAQFDAEQNTQRIKTETKNFSLRVNGRFMGLSPAQMNSGLGVENGFLTTSFKPTRPMAEELKHARSIGFAFHPASSSIFYGFEIPTSQYGDLVYSFLNSCYAD